MCLLAELGCFLRSVTNQKIKVNKKFYERKEWACHLLQGPDGGISASKYCYLGGFDATR
jgi:hypothetical protein